MRVRSAPPHKGPSGPHLPGGGSGGGVAGLHHLVMQHVAMAENKRSPVKDHGQPIPETSNHTERDRLLDQGPRSHWHPHEGFRARHIPHGGTPFANAPGHDPDLQRPARRLRRRGRAPGRGDLAELKPGRELHTNLEFYAGVVMALVGWSANILEQAQDSKIIRSAARYTGSAAGGRAATRLSSCGRPGMT